MASRQVLKPRRGTPERVDKANGKTVFLVAKRWHVLEVMARAFGWARLVELGVFRGWTTLHLLQTVPGLTVMGVDLYRQPTGEDAETYDGDLDAVYGEVVDLLRPYGNRASLLRMATVDAAAFVPDGSVDCVFIDADHRTEAVVADIEAWRPKVEPGGWIMGHDWHWKSVRPAVIECLGEPVLFPDNVWGCTL